VFETLAKLDPLKLPILDPGQRIGACVPAPPTSSPSASITSTMPRSGRGSSDRTHHIQQGPSCIVGATTICGSLGIGFHRREVELAVVINRDCSEVSKQDALGFVAGYCICHDVSERKSQIERAGSGSRARASRPSDPRPWLVTPKDAPGVNAARLWLEVNDEKMQDGNTDQMIFPIADIVSYVSQFMLLRAGDVITTGTPKGVGLSRKPPRYLKRETACDWHRRTRRSAAARRRASFRRRP